MLSLGDSDNGRTVNLRPGEDVHITLSESPGGYRWVVDRFDQKLIEHVGAQSHYEGTAIGSGGESELIFRARKAGTGEIVLKSWREWEGESSVKSRFRIVLHVKP